MTATSPPVSIPLQTAPEGLNIIVGLVSNNTSGNKNDSSNWQWTNSSQQQGKSIPAICMVRVDTGSCGLILPISTFFVNGEFSVSYSQADGEVATTTTTTGTLLPGVTTDWEPVIVNYQPSGNNIFGYYMYVSDLGIGDQNAPSVVVASKVRVIAAVNRNTCMLGVGFSRPMMADNLFLAPLTSTTDGSPLNPSYYLDASTVMLGGAPMADESNITWQGVDCLKPGTTGMYQDSTWAHPCGSVQLGANYFPKISILPDSGTGAMLVNYFGTDFPPANSKTPLGTTNMAVCFIPNADFSQSSPPALSYNFDVSLPTSNNGSQSVMHLELTLDPPDYVASNGNSSMPAGIYVYGDIGSMQFVNTGCHVMQQFGMIFDAAASRFGMVALQKS